MGLWARVRDWFRRPRNDVRGYTGSSVYPIGYDASAPRSGTRELWRMYRKSPWVFAVTDRLAHERATKTRLMLWDGPEDDPTRARVQRGSPAYEVLECWRRPIRVASGQIITPRQRTKLLSSWWDGVGEAYLVKQRGPGGRVVGLVPINPLWVTSKPSVQDPFYSVTPDGARSFAMRPDDVLPIENLDLENPYGRGVGLGLTTADEIDTDEGCAEAARAVVQNMGRPQGVLVIKNLTAQQKQKTEAEWRERYGGPGKAGRIDIYGGEAPTFIPLQPGSLFGDTIEARKFLRDMFIQLHGFSPEVFGVLEGSTRDSAYLAHRSMALGAVVPWLDALTDALQTHLVPEFADPAQVFLGYESPLPEDDDFKARVMSIAPSAFRVKDARELAGVSPDPDPEFSETVLASNPATATPTQLPPTPDEARKRGARAMAAARDPAFVAGLLADRATKG